MKYNLLSFLCAVTVIAYLQRSAISVPTQQIELDLGLNPQLMGIVFLAWYVGYAAFQVPSGWVADRIGLLSALQLLPFASMAAALAFIVGTRSARSAGLTVPIAHPFRGAR